MADVGPADGDRIEHTDVLVVGAGLSGIGAACWLRRSCPDKSVIILEARDRIGGTWDLFRYPGVRSDSDMFTLGYEFRPWRSTTAVADGSSILAYVTETAREFGVDRQIRFGHRVVRAEWSSETSRWTVTGPHEVSSPEVATTCLGRPLSCGAKRSSGSSTCGQACEKSV